MIQDNKFLEALYNIFKDNGILQKNIPNYKFRQEQYKLVEEIGKMLLDGGTLVAQAGTGTGKTFAYLIPALLAGGKVMISTASKTLQDQLYNKDLPVILKSLSIPLQVSLLKGRNNYICQYYLQETLEYGLVAEKQDVIWLQKIDRFAKTTSSGDKSECNDVPENAPIWAAVTATKDTCLGSQCDYYNTCFMVKARRDAMLADVVVVNHHLFVADIMLQKNDIELLPKVNTVIFDEAHHLPHIATNFFGHRISTLQIIDLARALGVEGSIHAPEISWAVLRGVLEKEAKDTRLMLKDGKYQWQDIEKNEEFINQTKDLLNTLDEISGIIFKQSGRHEAINRLWERCEELKNNLQIWLNKDSNNVHWLDVHGHSMQWHTTPLDISKQFSAKQNQTWIFTSATLAVNDNFEYFVRELGLDLPMINSENPNVSQNRNLKTLAIHSPFEYKNSLLYIPKNLLDVTNRAYHKDLMDKSWSSILSSGGHALILCTTLKGVNECSFYLQELLKSHDLEWPLLVQGQNTKAKLLSDLKNKPNAILIGSLSFWEGIDIVGKALQLVIIDKLPFTTPDDPIHAGKIKHLQSQEINAFSSYQVPLAAITLQQGVGRLIRNEKDKGVLIIGDKRIIEKSYGKSLIKSLPNFSITHNEQQVINFFQNQT